ncbi:hypothetical protein [Paenibacillus sp. NPDC055715]
MKELKASAGKATVKTLDSRFPTCAVKIPFLRQKKPRRIIKTVEAMELRILLSVKVDVIICSKDIDKTLSCTFFHKSDYAIP